MDLKSLGIKYNLADLELFTQNISTQKISFVANKLKHAESVHTNGVALRLIHNKKIGFTSNYKSNIKDLNQIEKMVLQALELSKFSPEVNIELPGESQTCSSKNGKNVACNSLTVFEEKGNHIIETILKEAPNVLVDVSFDISEIDEGLENTRGLGYSHSKDLYSFSVNIRETIENDFIDIYTGMVDETLPKHMDDVSEILKYYKLSKKHAKIKGGSWPVLFTSKAVKDLFNVIELALNGKQVNQKSSPWHNKLGKQVLSGLITLKQDPSFGYMARSHDDEGVAVRPLILVDNGILENFYFDLLNAHRKGLIKTPSGNGFKPSLSSKPEPNLLNIIVSSGNKSMDEIVRNIDYGLLVDQTMGGLTTNISGDMSVNVDVGFLIEKGELIGRVKDTMVSGNIYNALSDNNVLELSNSPKWHWSNIYNPDVLIGGFMVTG